MTFTGEVHPLAARWPMLPDDELAALADSIAAEGLLTPLVVDVHGRLLDGRNRLAACTQVAVDPVFVEHDATNEADIRAFINAQNAHRRNVSTGQKAMAVAEQLATEGKRANGRWRRESLGNTESRDTDQRTWLDAMRLAGLVIDQLPELADQVISGEVALSDAADRAAKKRDEIKDQAEKKKREAEQLAELRKRKPEVAALVDAGELTLADGIATVAAELEAEEKERRDHADMIAKFSSDLAVSISCIAPLSGAKERREQVAELNLREIPAVPITESLVLEAIASLHFILDTHYRESAGAA